MKKRPSHNTGRPKGMSKKNQKKCEKVHQLNKEKKLSINEACKKVKISKSTFYRWDRKRKEKSQKSG